MKKYLLLVLLVSCAATAGSFAREGTEWVTAYWYNATDSKLPRVLLIGDSILKGYQTFVRDDLAGEAYVAFYATSKGIEDPSYLRELAYMLDANEYGYAVIQLNNGLHSLYADRRQWEQGLCAALDVIQEKGKGAKVIWASSTPLKDSALTEKAKELNSIAARVMKDRNIPIDDLFGLMDPLNRAAYWVDTYHYTADGERQQAQQVTEAIRAVLGTKQVTQAEAKAALNGAASETGPDGKIAPGTVVESVGVLKNPDFESSEGWRIYPPDPTKATLTFGTDEAPGGKHFAKIEAHIDGIQFYQSAPAFISGKTYALTCWLRAEAPARVTIFLRTKKPPYAYVGNQAVDIGPEWKACSLSLVIPPDYVPEDNALFFVFPTAGTYQIANVTVTQP